MRAPLLAQFLVISGLTALQGLAQQSPGQQLPPGQQRSPQPLPQMPSGSAPQIFNFTLPVPKAVCEATAEQLKTVMDAKTALVKELTELMKAHAKNITKHSKGFKTPKAAAGSNTPEKPQLAAAFNEFNTSLAVLNGQQAQLAAQMGVCTLTITPNGSTPTPIKPLNNSVKVAEATVFVIGDSSGR